MRRILPWLIGGLVALAVLATGGTWVYIHLVEGDAPARLSLSEAPATGGAPDSGTADGTWDVTGDSQVGYRVDEVLFGQDTTAVGRTNEVTGSVTITGRTVSAATFTVDMASVTTDRSRRDDQYRGRIMATDQHPISTFRLTSPIELSSVPADGATVSAPATGDLTLRGVTRSVSFEVKARRTGDRLEVNGSIHVTFDAWGIPSPSFGPASVEDEGDVEFLLVLGRA